MREALQRYCAVLAPRVTVRNIPMALASAATLMAYYNRHGEHGDPSDNKIW